MRRAATVHGSGTDAFSRRKTNIFLGRDKTPKRRLSVKMGLSPSLAREGYRRAGEFKVGLDQAEGRLPKSGVPHDTLIENAAHELGKL